MPEHLSPSQAFTQEGQSFSEEDLIAAALAEADSVSKQEQSAQAAEIEPSQNDTPTLDDLLETEEQIRATKHYMAEFWLHHYTQNQPATDTRDPQHPPVNRQTANAAVRQRPNWESRLPSNGATEQDWLNFVKEQPIELQSSLLYLQQKAQQRAELYANPQITAEASHLKAEKLKDRMHAISYRHLGRVEKAIVSDMQTQRIKAMQLIGEIPPHMKAELETKAHEVARLDRARDMLVSGPGMVDELQRLLRLDDRQQLRSGLVMTEQMATAERKHLPSIVQGKPTLLIGETGGAKTALAKHIAREVLGVTGREEQGYEFISGYAEVNAYQIMGKNELRNEDGTPVTEFFPGALTRAMEQGKPIILDEINAMPAEFLKRLNEILLLSPGDSYTIQEDSGRKVIIKEGFCIIGTMNEKSERYRGTDELSVELRARFTNEEQIRYPDLNTIEGKIPPELMRIALAAITNSKGEEIFDDRVMSNIEFVDFVKAANITQQMFSKPASDASLTKYNEDSNRSVEGQTGLREAVISPRKMIDIIQKVQMSGGATTLRETVADFLANVKDKTDQAVIQNILEAHYLFGKEVHPPLQQVA